MKQGVDATLPDTASGVDQAAVRRHNLGLVLRSIRDHGPQSRARIAATSGLTRATVSSLVGDLAARGLVREAGLERGNVGRPGQSVELDGHAVCGIGAEVNVNHVGAMALDLRGEVVGAYRHSLDTARMRPGDVLDHVAKLVRRTLDDVAARRAHPVGMTLGVAGLVDSAAGVLTLGANLDWHDVPVAELTRERLGHPAYPLQVDNESNLAAIAEASTIAEGERDDVVVLVGEVGLGGGIISDGRLLRGRQGFAGEIGHMTVDPQGRRCGCGRTGCWETLVGLHALLRAAADPDDPVHDPGIGLEDRLAELNRRAEVGDARTLAALEEVGRWVGVGASALVNVLNPRALVLSGYLAVVGGWMLDAVRAGLDAGSIAPRSGDCRLELSGLGFSAAVRGGAQVALDAVFHDPTVVARRADDVPDPVGGNR